MENLQTLKKIEFEKREERLKDAKKQQLSYKKRNKKNSSYW